MRAERRCWLFFHHLQKSASCSFHLLGAVAAASNRVSLHRFFFFFFFLFSFPVSVFNDGLFLTQFPYFVYFPLHVEQKKRKNFLAFFSLAFYQFALFVTLGRRVLLAVIVFFLWREPSSSSSEGIEHRA